MVLPHIDLSEIPLPNIVRFTGRTQCLKNIIRLHIPNLSLAFQVLHGRLNCLPFGQAHAGSVQIGVVRPLLITKGDWAVEGRQRWDR